MSVKHDEFKETPESLTNNNKNVSEKEITSVNKTLYYAALFRKIKPSTEEDVLDEENSQEPRTP